MFEVFFGKNFNRFLTVVEQEDYRMCNKPPRQKFKEFLSLLRRRGVFSPSVGALLISG